MLFIQLNHNLKLESTSTASEEMSYKEGCHPIFSFTEEEKQDIRKALGLKESTIQDDIDAILEWFGKQPHLIEAGLPERAFVERMLVNAKGSREKVKRRIDNFYKHRSMAPELIQNREYYLNSNREIFTYYRFITSPKLMDLKRVTVIKFTDPDANNFSIDVLLRNSLMLGDIRLRHDYLLGDVWILDLKNTSISHLLRLNPVVFSKGAQIFFDGLGIRIAAVYIVGAPSYAQQLLQFISKFIKPKIFERITVIDTLEELYKDVPKAYLPKDYGGDLPSLNYFTDQCQELLRSEKTKKFLIECSKQISDENKRPGADIHNEFLNGSFKKLDLD